MSSSAKKGQFDMNATPRVLSGLNLNKLRFSLEEGFLFSRVDGNTNIEVLVKSSGMTQQEALSVLLSLKDKGVITWEGADSPTEVQKIKTPNKKTTQEEIWEQGYEFESASLAEQVDLDQNTKKKVFYLYDKLDELTYYEMLRVGHQADSKDIKRAYFRVSREFHPDSYFRKELGSYRSKIETLFKRIGRAYETLSKPETRKEYDATLPPDLNPEVPRQKELSEEQKQKDMRLAQERRQRLLKRSPIMSRKTKAQTHYNDALEQKTKNDPVGAANNIRLALALDPNNTTYQAFLAEVGPKAGEIRAEKELRRGRAEESMGRYEEALQAYLQAIESNPREVGALERAAFLLCSLERDLRQALSFCRKALMIEPDNVKLRMTLSDIYLALDMHKNAIRELSEYIRQNPLDERAVEKLHKLKSKS